jgi:hypothetical protein
MRLALIAVLAVLNLLSPPALAQERQQAPSVKVDIDGQMVTVPTPFGYCDLDADHARDRLLIAGFDRMWAHARVLRRLSPCEELQSWRAGRSAEPVEVVLVLWLAQHGTAADRRTFLRRATPGEVMGKPRVMERAREGFPAGPTEDQFTAIGVIERTDRAVFAAEAVVARIDGSRHQLSVLSATTAVGPTPLVIHVYSPYEDGSELDWMLRDAREHVDRLLSANGEPSRRFGDRRAPMPAETTPGDVQTRKARVPRQRSPGIFDTHGGYIALGMLIGGVLLIAVGLLVAKRLRPAP